MKRLTVMRKALTAGGSVRVQFGVQDGPEEAEQSEHAQASDPDAEQRPRRLGVGQIEAEREQGSHRHPGYGNGERDVVDAAAVVELVTDGPVGDIGTGGIECAGAEQLSVKLPPAAVSGVGEDGKRDQEHEFFGQIREVEIDAVGRFIDLHGLPWDDGVYIDEDPPDEQEGKVEHADSFIPFIFPKMRKHREGGDHGHQMQEQNNIAQEEVGHVLTLVDFKVIPHSLVSKPEEHTRAHEDPEEPDVEQSGSASARYWAGRRRWQPAGACLG